MVDYLIQSSLSSTPLHEIASKLCCLTNEFVSLRKYLLKKDLPSYFDDADIPFSKDFRVYYFPDLFWNAVWYKNPCLYTYPLGDSIERSLKRTMAFLLLPKKRRNSAISEPDNNTNAQQRLYSISRSLTIDYLLKHFLTYLFFEICLTNLRSKTNSKTDLGYAYHFSNGYLVSLTEQAELRNELIKQCEQLGERLLPYFLKSLKEEKFSSMLSTVFHGMNKIIFSRLTKYDVNKHSSSKPFINVIVGLKPKTDLDSQYELAADYIRIILDGKYRNVTLDLGDIEYFLGHSIHSLTKDLLEIAFVVYISDLYTERNSDLSRRLGILMPVRHPDIWNLFSSQLGRTVSFLARDDVKMHFTKKKEACDDVKDFGSFEDKKKCCCLLSGGLDSAAGVVWALSKNLSPLLISYSSGNLSGIQKNVVNEIEQKTGQTLRHLTISWQAGRRKKGSYRLGVKSYSILTQHLRSFFYLSLATAAAIESNCKNVYAFENGPIAINPLTSESHVNTRTVHPIFLNYFQSLINSIFRTRVAITNPFIYKTKGELARYLVNKGTVKDLIPSTSSCFRYARVKSFAQRWYNIVDYDGRHCGECLPCIARRVSLHHSKAPNKYDDYLINVFDIFNIPIFLTQPEHSLETIVRIADLLRFCQYISTMHMNELIIAFPDLYICSKGLDNNKLTDMYKRYAEQTIRTFRDKSSKEFKDIFRTALKFNTHPVGGNREINRTKSI